jgi:hypothetical protein
MRANESQQIDEFLIAEVSGEQQKVVGMWIGNELLKLCLPVEVCHLLGQDIDMNWSRSERCPIGIPTGIQQKQILQSSLAALKDQRPYELWYDPNPGEPVEHHQYGGLGEEPG